MYFWMIIVPAIDFHSFILVQKHVLYNNWVLEYGCCFHRLVRPFSHSEYLLLKRSLHSPG